MTIGGDMFYSRDEFQSQMDQLINMGWSETAAYRQVCRNEWNDRIRYERAQSEEKFDFFNEEL